MAEKRESDAEGQWWVWVADSWKGEVRRAGPYASKEVALTFAEENVDPVKCSFFVSTNQYPKVLLPDFSEEPEEFLESDTAICDCVDHVGGYEGLKFVQMKDEFEGGIVLWCESCRERFDDMVEKESAEWKGEEAEGGAK